MLNSTLQYSRVKDDTTKKIIGIPIDEKIKIRRYLEVQVRQVHRKIGIILFFAYEIFILFFE